MPDRTASYLARALAARAALWGNHGYEAADAFWSITMYDLPDFYLVPNPIDRYSIGDRTPGLRRAGDGSPTIVMQHEPPADTSNWLPAPAAPFRPILRMYQPRPAVLDGGYRLPPVTKAPVTKAPVTKAPVTKATA